MQARGPGGPVLTAGSPMARGGVVPRVLRCVGCGAVVSRPLLEIVGGSAPLFDAQGERYAAGMRGASPERGTLWQSDGSLEWGARGDVVVHADDVVGLARVGSWSGCCGPTGMDGENLACPSGHAIATRVADCWTPSFVAFTGGAVAIDEASGEVVFPGAAVVLDPGRPLREASALWLRLHEVLGCSGWYGAEVATLLEDRVTATDAPIVVVWREAATSRAAGLPVEAVLDAFVAARRRLAAPVMLVPGGVAYTGA